MRKFTPYLLSFIFCLAIISPVFAHVADNRGQGNSKGTVLATSSARFAKNVNLRARIASKSADRLLGARLQACEKVERNLNTFATRITNALNNHSNALERIQARVESLAADREATTKLPNYAALLAAVNTAHEDADAAIADIKDVPDIDCSSENPKGAVAEIKASFKDAKDALKAYHRALRDLLVAVASIGKTNTSTSSATPSGTAN